MLKNLKKLAKTQSGFTLTEVMIGIMILTVAIVSATNLLVGLIQSNQNNLTTMQAYYLAQEGIEGVRNVRDTNWLHNRDWLGDGSELFWGEKFMIPGDIDDENSYSMALEYNAFNQDPMEGSVPLQNLVKTWDISVGDGRIFRNRKIDDHYLSSSAIADAEDTGFKRTILIKKYDCSDLDCSVDQNTNYVLVESKVTWLLGSRERELTLSEVLSDWKGGAL